MKDNYVHLIPTRDPASNQVQWTMVYGNHVGKTGSYPIVDLPENSGKHKIIFKIVDPTNLGVTFDPKVLNAAPKPDVVNAIWINEGSGNKSISQVYPSQIKKVVLQDGNRELVVDDDNNNDETLMLTYQLNFVNPNSLGEKVTAIDPEIRNGGGGTQSFIGNMEAVAILLGGAVLLLTGLLWFNHFRIARKLGITRAKTEGRAM